MGRLLYNDGILAVCDFEIGENNDEKAVRLLLGADTESPDTEKHVKPLLECWDIPILLTDLPFTGSEQENVLARASKRKLKELGISADGSSISPMIQFPSSTTLRFVTSVPHTVSRIKDTALLLQFLARLHLLTNGDARHASMLPEAGIGSSGLELNVELPDMLFIALTGCVLPTPATFDVDGAEPGNQEGFTSIAVEIPYDRMHRYPTDSEGDLFVLPADAFALKCMVAAYLLSSFVNYCSATPYTVNPESLRLAKSNSSTFASTLADLAIAGKIGACPYCGRPVFMPRKTSKPFCRQSHQTRYSERARQMLNRGAEVDEVADAFPHIRYGTISGWLPMGGRKGQSENGE